MSKTMTNLDLQPAPQSRGKNSQTASPAPKHAAPGVGDKRRWGLLAGLLRWRVRPPSNDYALHTRAPAEDALQPAYRQDAPGKDPRTRKTAPAAAPVKAESAGKQQRVGKQTLSAPAPYPIIGQLQTKTQIAIVLSAGVLLLLGSVYFALIGLGLGDRAARVQRQVSASAYLARSLRANMQYAMDGSALGFQRARQASAELRESMAHIGVGPAISGEPTGASTATVLPSWDDGLWSSYQNEVFGANSRNALAPSIDALGKVLRAADKIIRMEPEIAASTGPTASLSARCDDLVLSLATVQSPWAQRSLPQARLAQVAVAAISSSDGSASAIDKAEAALEQLLLSLDAAPAAARSEPAFQSAFSMARSLLDGVQHAVRSAYLKVRPELHSQMKSLDTATNDAVSIAEAFADTGAPLAIRRMWFYAGLLTVLAMLDFALLLLINSKAASIAAWDALKEQRETDEAILRIMAELRPISQGDYTARLSVTEHVTGTVADRVNLMTEAVQASVSEVKVASHNAEQSMDEIVKLVDQANQTTSIALQEAQSSRSKSEAGANAVARAVAAMNIARAKIQEVSKRVKAQGEMAQSITTVVDVIEMLTEKTKVLALNTALLASQAGAGGQRYRALAKEIDKMSSDTQRSLTSIKIAVEGMQAETQQVITTVEAVTTEVVMSSRMWDEAMVALGGITTSSETIQHLVHRVDEIARCQADAAAKAAAMVGRSLAEAKRFRTSADEAIADH